MAARHSETQFLSLTAAGIGGQTTAADYARALAQGVEWLRFEPAIEAEYRRSHILRVRPQARFWQLLQLAIGLIGIKIVAESQATGAVHLLLLACVAAHVAVSAMLTFLAFSERFVTSYHRVASILMPFRATAFAIVVAAIIDAGGSGTAAMTINLFGLLFFSGLLLRQALPAALAMSVAFMAALTAFDVHATLAAYSISSMLIVLGLATFVAWDMQRAARAAFLEHGLTRADATRDALTGLVNRRHFDGRLQALWKSCEAARQPLTLMLVDVDHFKAYNDGHGHQAGDDALRQVAQALCSAARPGDLVARYGGEEMALIATGLGEHEAEALGARLRRAVEALGMPHEGLAEPGCVTVSIGGACIVPQTGRSAAGALQIADENLYEAKRQGRNRVIFQTDQYAEMQTGFFRKPVREGSPG
jgi:diguanylate cyclase (GGDEF)-like protein